jgi:hypothetical protein
MQPVLLHFTPTEYDALKARADNAVDPTELAQSLTSKVSVGTPLLLPPGSAAAGSAPLRLTSQTTPLAVVEQGALELIGNSLQFSQFVRRRGVMMSQDVRTTDTVIANSTVETTISTTNYGASYWEVGKAEETRLFGQFAQTTTGSGSLFIRVKYNGTTVLTMSTAIGTVTARPFTVFIIRTVRSVGPTGTIQINGRLSVDAVTNDADSTVLAVRDTTVAGTVTVTAQWNVANVANTVTFQQGYVLSIEPNR